MSGGDSAERNLSLCIEVGFMLRAKGTWIILDLSPVNFKPMSCSCAF